MNVFVRCGRTVCSFLKIACSSPQRFGRDSRFMLNKFFGALAANLGSGSTDGGLSSIAVCSLHGCDGSNFHIVSFLLGGSTCGTILRALVWCCAFGPLLRSEMEGDRPPPLRHPMASQACVFLFVFVGVHWDAVRGDPRGVLLESLAIVS